MKKITLLLIMLTISFSYAQDLPLDFETSPVTADMSGFDGGVITVEAVVAPQSTGNSSVNLAKLVKGAGQPWAGAKIVLDTPFDFSTNSNIEARIYTTAPVGSKIEFKAEGGGAASGAKYAYTTKSGEWETLTFDFLGVTATNLTDLVIIPWMPGDAQGDGSEAATFYFDDIIQTAPPAATCDDGIQNGDETGIDCGGTICGACPEVKLPLDFSDASQLFTHDGAGAGGSVVLENGKLRFNGNGQAYDQAYLDLTEIFSTFDSDNNTFTVRMEPLLVPAGEERTHLLKVSIGEGAAIEIPGKSIGSDEQDVTFNFGITGAEDWNRITIFMDFGPDGANTYNAKVTDYLISSITLGEDPPEVVPTNAATAPIAREAGDVISIFSDAYTDVALGEVDPDWSPATVETITIDGDNIWKLTGCDFFSVTQYDGIDFSEMEMMHIDFFTPDAAGLAVGVKLVDTVTSANEIISLGNTVSGAWTSVDVDLSTVSMDISNITQILYDPSSEGQTHYIDNFYFYRAATATVEDFAVNSVKMYPNPAKGFVNFSSASNEALDVAVYDMLGKEVLRANAVQSQLNISSLNPGMYFVNMTQGSNVSTKKLLVN
jgi:hypothetical protein